jgi:LEA14-like dessication related protein
MKAGGVLATLAVAGALLFAAARYRVAPQMVTRSMRLRLGKISFAGNWLKVAVIISNPTSDAININSVVGELYINGKKVGNVESFVQTVIQPNAKTTLYLDVRLMAVQLLKTYQELLEQKGFNVEIGLTGSINVNNKVTPFQIYYDVLNYA